MSLDIHKEINMNIIQKHTIENESSDSIATDHVICRSRRIMACHMTSNLNDLTWHKLRIFRGLAKFVNLTALKLSLRSAALSTRYWRKTEEFRRPTTSARIKCELFVCYKTHFRMHIATIVSVRCVYYIRWRCRDGSTSVCCFRRFPYSSVGRQGHKSLVSLTASTEAVKSKYGWGGERNCGGGAPSGDWVPL